MTGKHEQFDTHFGGIVTVSSWLDITTLDRHLAPEINIRNVPMHLTPAEARELAAALEAAIAKAEAWEKEDAHE